MRSKYVLIGLSIVAAMAAVAVAVSAGDPNNPPGPPETTYSYTLEDIYDRLDTGAARTPITFTEPISGPTFGTGHTLDEIMAVAPQVDDTNGATTSQVVSGTTYWGLRNGAWGLQTGAATAGGNVTGGDGQLTFTIPDGFYSGSKTASAQDADLAAGNITQGIDLFGVVGSAVVATGDATLADVLTGTTFSSGSGSGLSGAMPNNGAMTIVPTTTQQTIAAGYHDGGGYVTGDTDLVAGNIAQGVDLFGVAGDPNVANTASGDAAAGDILSGRVAWVDGSEVMGNRAPAPVLKTGQTISYTVGDDGDLEMGVGWITSTRFITGTTGVVTDTLTGLVWLKNANCAAFFSDDFTGQNARNWSNALSAANALAGGYCGLTDGSSAGDWRLPSVRELLSLIDYGEWNPALPDGHPFSGVQLDNYWSSSTWTPNVTYAWMVGLHRGHLYDGSKTSLLLHVWPVRGGQ
jgi:hypothetical protein